MVAVEGPNGSGKSTLLAAAAGLLPADVASVRPGSIGYSPERAGVLPRIQLQRWLLGLARTAGLDRDESARRAGDLLARLGLAHASAVPLHALSRGNAQRALVAQALLADPDLLILDEPSGGMSGRRRGEPGGGGDPAGREPPGRGAGRAAPCRAAAAALRPDLAAARRRCRHQAPGGATSRHAAGLMEVETGDGTVRQVDEAGLPAVLRAALDAGQAIRRVQPVLDAGPGVVPAAAVGPSAAAGTGAAVRPGAAARPTPRRAAPPAGCCTARRTGPGCSPRRSGSWRPRCCS